MNRLSAATKITVTFLSAVTAALAHPAVGTFGWPLASDITQTRISQPYSCFDCTTEIPNLFHSGLDMRPCDTGTTSDCLSKDTRVFAVADGYICKILINGKNDNGFGNAVVISHANGLFTLYAHLAEAPKNAAGEKLGKKTDKHDGSIKRRQQIGTMGGTGDGSKTYYVPHLHFAVLESCNVGSGYHSGHPYANREFDPWLYFNNSSLSSVNQATILREPLLGVRSGPNSRSDFMDFDDLGFEQNFIIIAETLQWLYVDLPCGQKYGHSGSNKACAGWIKKHDETCHKADNKCIEIRKATKRLKLNSTDVVPIRVGAGTTNAKITGKYSKGYPLRIWKGQQFPIRSGPSRGKDSDDNKCDSDNWFEIDIAQNSGYKTGWVCADHLDITIDATIDNQVGVWSKQIWTSVASWLESITHKGSEISSAIAVCPSGQGCNGDIPLPTEPSQYVTLNDTGLTGGSSYPDGYNSTCIGETIAEQDCSHGRDATHNDNSDGHAGFSFTKLDSSGNSLAASARAWSCVKDNVTGLVWEVKTNNGGIHDKNNTYRWGGVGAMQYRTEFYSDWNELVNGSNSEVLCGYSDWRVPSINELLNIVSYDRENPTIDTDYFPNTVWLSFWSSSAGAGLSGAWGAHFGYGASYGYGRDNDQPVRLVRGGSQGAFAIDKITLLR